MRMTSLDPVRLALCAAVLLTATPSSFAQDPNEICVPLLSGDPAIDGEVEASGGWIADANWAGSAKVMLSAAAGGSGIVTLRAGRTSTDVFLSFVASGISAHEDLTLVFALSTDGNAVNDWRIHIKPFTIDSKGIGVSNQDIASAFFWRVSGSWNGGGAMGTDARSSGILDNMGTHGDVKISRDPMSQDVWAIEIRLPWHNDSSQAASTDSVYFSDPGAFKLYANVVHLSATTPVQVPFPPGAVLTGGGSDITQRTPSVTAWGDGSFEENADVCIPAIGGLAGLPKIDGLVDPVGTEEGDPGWNRALRLNLNTGFGVPRTASIQMGRAGAFLYVGVTVETGLPPAEDDTLVLGFSTNSAPAKDWRFQIKPFELEPSTIGPNDVFSDKKPHSADFWRDSTMWNTPTAGKTDALTELLDGTALNGEIKCRSDGTVWSVEMKIPTHSVLADVGLNSKVYFPSTGVFKIYLNVIKTAPGPIVTQMAWPSCAIIYPNSGTEVKENTPDVDLWGNASFNDRPECTGIFLTWDKIGVKDPTASANLISTIRRFEPDTELGEPAFPADCDDLADDAHWSEESGEPFYKGLVNVFSAQPFNSTPANAQGSARFRLANWGIPGATDWATIQHASLLPELANPTPEGSVIAEMFGDLKMDWQLSYKESCIYSKARHQCIHVDLDSTDPLTRFKNKSMQRNMDFVAASTFEQEAEISGRGYRGPLKGLDHHQFLVSVFADVRKVDRKRPEPGPVPKDRQEMAPASRLRLEEADPLLAGSEEAMVWIARGYIRTGRMLRVNGNDYEMIKFVGGFGYVAGHEEEGAEWTHDLTGTGVEKVGDGLYSINVPPDAAVRVLTRIQATDIKRSGWGLSMLFLFILILGLMLILVWYFFLRKR